MFSVRRSKFDVRLFFPATRAALARLRRRPDAWLVAFTLALLALILATTRLSLRAFDRLALDHLSDSFGVGFFTIIVGVFTEKLLRAAPTRPRRTLRVAWLSSTAVLTAGLLVAYGQPTAYATNWLLQALVLATLATSTLVALLLPAAGFIYWRHFRLTAADVSRHWCTVILSLFTGGYLLATVRIFSPEVIDPILLRMDVSLGFHAAEIIRPFVVARPWLDAASDYGYPLLGLFLALTAGCLHLAGATTALRRCLLALLLVALLGKVCYWNAPGIGPQHAYPDLVTGAAALPGGQPALDALRENHLAGPDRLILKTHLSRDVMPSLHTAFSLVALAAAWSHRRRLFYFLLPLGFVQIATTLTKAVHYTVDLIAAVPLAILCWSLADAALRRFPPPHSAPLPPLRLTGPRLQKNALALGLSLLASLATLILWAKFAPLSPWLAWPLVALITALPAALALRLHTAAPTLRSSAPATRTGDTVVRHRLLATATFCTGGTALLLEQISEKYLSTLLGSSRPAATIVLAVYFAGLALGAWLCPKKAAGAPRRLAFLELFIAAWAVLLVTAFFATDRALGAWLADTGTTSFTLTAARLTVALLWLLPPTLAMGAQLPTLAAVLATQPDAPSLPRLYSLNLLGAFAFTLLAPPLLFNPLGASGTLWFVALLGLFIALALWTGLPPSKFEIQSSPFDVPQPTLPPSFSPSSSILGPAAAAAAAGFAFFALEVTWFHLISAVCGASTYTFSILLAALLLALALAGRRAAPTATSPAALLGALLGALALTLVLSNALWPWAGRLLATLRAALDLRSFWSGELLKLAVVTALVLPPAYFLGQIFPRLLRASATSAHVGRLCTANVLGCVAGALATGFLLLPSFGSERTLQLLTLLAATVSLLLSRFTARPPPPAEIDAQSSTFEVRRSPPLSLHLLLSPSLFLPFTALVLLVSLPRWDRLELTRGYGVYLAPQLPLSAQLVSFREDFRAGFVTVVSTPSTASVMSAARPAPTLTLLQNGKFDADDAGEVPAQISFGLIAAVHAPAQTRALVIGAGSGQTASIVSRLGFAHLDIAEISPAHLAAARAHFSHLHHGVFDRPGVTVHVEDGRNHLLRTRERYDAIQIELTSVWFAGATNLYSREFYALARTRLAPGGVLVQWLQLHHLTPREIATILATARAEFPGVAVWRAGAQACLIGFTAPPRLNAEVWKLWRTSPVLATERAHPALVDLDLPVALLRREILSAARTDSLLSRYAAHVGLNTDPNRWLEFQTPKYYLSRRDHASENLRWLDSAPRPSSAMTIR